MIPILCESDEKKIGFLKDSVKAEVTEARNGSYELLLEYPVSGEYYPEIAVDRYIKAKPNMISKNQYFRIYTITKPINGIVTVKGEHVSYAMTHYPVDAIELSNVTAQAAVNMVLSRSSSSLSQPHKFRVGTCDLDTLSNFKARACSARAALGGIEGSVLDTYGGEYEFDNFTVNLYKNRGADNGVQIIYGKNMTDLKFDISMQNSYTGIFGYCYTDKDELVTLDDPIVHVQNTSGIDERILLLDFSSSFKDGEAKTKDNLQKHINEYLTSNDINSIEGTMQVSMIDLSQTENYKDMAALEAVSLCDTVHVKHRILRVTVNLKVIKITYDVLKEKNKTIELGSAKSSFADTIKQLTKTTNKAKEVAERTKSQLVEEYKKAIEDATAAITGYSGGYVRLNPSENPSEILILEDSPDIETAKKIWRFNSAGLAYSSDGYDGPYGPALLAGGKFVINDITAQTISANLIRAGMLTSVDGKTYFNLDGNEIVTSSDTRTTKISAGAIVKTYKDKIKEISNCGYGTNNGVKTYYSNSITQPLDDANKSTGYGRHATDKDGTIIPIVTEDTYGHHYHSTIETAKSRTATGASDPASQKQLFAGFRHYRYVNSKQYNVALGLGITDSKPSAVLELQDASGVINARVDFFGTNVIGELCFKGHSKGKYSTAVSIGSDYINLPSGTSYNIQDESVIYRKIDGSNAVGNEKRTLYLYGDKIAVSGGKLFCLDGFSNNPNEFSTYGVVSSETIEELPSDVSEYFKESEIIIQPQTLTTYSTGETTLIDENGEVTVIPAEETTHTSEAAVSFVKGTVPDIIRGDENTVDVFGMACLEWKAIKELYEKQQELTDEILRLKGEAGG